MVHRGQRSHGGTARQRGATERQVPATRAGITADQGLFGHGSAVAAVR
ncbi:hypothetical protein ACFU8W_12505 [Streptomyces sp. NPDC057565]